MTLLLTNHDMDTSLPPPVFSQRLVQIWSLLAPEKQVGDSRGAKHEVSFMNVFINQQVTSHWALPLRFLEGTFVVHVLYQTQPLIQPSMFPSLEKD